MWNWCFVLAKRLSEKEKEEMIELFSVGKTIDELSKQFNCTKLTISRNLKKKLGEKRYEELISKGQSLNQSTEYKQCVSSENNNELNHASNFENYPNEEIESFPITPFMEITPLNCQIENEPQKELSSEPISEIEFPKIVYMIVDKKIELETKYLKDYPEWQFLSKEELNRKTIEIYTELKIAKRFCNKEQKVIKVPNTNVFKIVAPMLVSRGISRIISSDKLIAL